MQQDFTLTGEYIALNDLLKICGVADSGGAGKALVASGAVSVDGAQELRKPARFAPAKPSAATASPSAWWAHEPA